MTLSFTVPGRLAVTAFRATHDDVEGYQLVIGGTSVFLSEQDADALARFFLFRSPPPASLALVVDDDALDEPDLDELDNE